MNIVKKVMLVLLVMVATIGMGFGVSFVSIYEELKAEQPTIVENLKSKGATDEEIENFLTTLGTELSGMTNLDESNFNSIMFNTMMKVIMVKDSLTETKPEYQRLGLALAVHYGDTLQKRELTGELLEFRNVVKNKVLGENITTPETPETSTPTSGGGATSSGGGTVAAGGSTSSVTMFDRATSNGVVQLKTSELKSLLEGSASKKTLSVDLKTLDLSKGEKLELKSLTDAVNSDKKVTLDLGSVKMTLTKDNKEILENTLAVQYTDNKLDVSLGDIVKDLDKPFKLQMPVPNGIGKSGLTVAKVLADGSFEPIGGYFSGETVTFFTDKPGQYVVINNEVAFNDLVIDDYWAAQKVERLASLGIISGKGEGAFDPAANISRAEFSALVTKMMKLDGGTATQSFNDLSNDAWYAPYVKTANAYGLMNGKGEGEFDPNGEITQQEILTVLSKLLQGYDVTTGSAESDSSYEMKTQTAATWAKPLIQTAISNGALRGMPLGNVDMSRAATRLETANMLYEIQSVLYQ